MNIDLYQQNTWKISHYGDNLMKLYAKIESDRASKGQGGNKQLNLFIYIDDRDKPRYQLHVTKRDDDSTDVVFIDMEMAFPNTIYDANIKGKQQKGDNYLFESPGKTIKRIKENPYDSRYDDVEI